MMYADIFSRLAGRRVFITGHTGFKGSWLTAILLQCGATVRGYALEPKGEVSHFNLLKLSSKVEHIVGDVRDLNHLASSLTEFRPDIVFHLAAQPLVRQSYVDPVSTIAVNVLGSAHLLEAVRRCGSVKSLVFVTSDKCYENVEWVWGYREEDPIGGRDPYSASKGAAEIVFSSFRRSFLEESHTVGSASVRAGNVIGGGDWSEDRIVPDCIRCIASEAPIQLRSPNATRPWQHVLEPLSGYLLLAARLLEEPTRWGGAWNFGPSSYHIRTVYDIAASIVSHVGRGEIVVLENLPKLHEAAQLQLNCDKAQNLLRWMPKWDVDLTLLKTAEWYKTWLDGGDVEAMTRRQISEYFPELR